MMDVGGMIDGTAGETGADTAGVRRAWSLLTAAVIRSAMALNATAGTSHPPAAGETTIAVPPSPHPPCSCHRYPARLHSYTAAS